MITSNTVSQVYILEKKLNLRRISCQARKMSKKWKALHKREFEEKMDPEFLEADKQLPLIENKGRREKMEYLEPPGVASDSLAKSPSSRLAKYFSGKKGAKSNYFYDKSYC